jgi:hypothetical protein
MTQTDEKLDFIRRYDPESAEKLKRLLDRKAALREGNVYGEKFTDRQFSLVFDPLLDTSFHKARIMESLAGGEEDTIKGLSQKLGQREDITFGHIKDLMKRNQVEISGHEGRNALFRKKQ